MALTDVQQSARAVIDRTLSEFGLGGLGAQAWQAYLAGKPIEQIILDLRSTPEYQARYPAMAELAKKGRAISEAQYQDIERTYVQVARAAGLPSGFYDSPQALSKFIAGEVSPSEFADRVKVAAQAAFQSPPEVRSELSRLYEVGPGDIVAYFIDPQHSERVVQQRFLAAQLGAASQRSGFGTLTLNEAERLAALNPSEDQAAKAFGTLAQSQELLTNLPGQETGAPVDRQEALEAAFGANDKAAQGIRKRASQRVAEFEQGGGFATSKQGFTGVGSAPSA